MKKFLIPAFAASLGLSACGGTPPEPIVDLVVDSNRNGLVEAGEVSEETGEETWDAQHGAVFLANIDDDDSDGKPDAEDDVVNGASDIADLMPFDVRAWPLVPAGATATLSFDALSADHVRVFRIDGDAALPASYVRVMPGAITLTDAQLKTGVHFAIESKDLVTSTDAAAWHGFADITLVATQKTDAPQPVELARDVIRARVAPVLLQFDTAPAERVFYTNAGNESRPLLAGLEPAADAAGASLEAINLSFDLFDQWTQDFFDVGYMSRPGPGGKPIGMHLFIRSAQPDRESGQWMIDNELGPDRAKFYTFDSNAKSDGNSVGYSMNSFGNWSVVPPYETATEKFPLGRNLFGEGSRAADQPDQKYIDFVRAQVVQPDIVVDTSWLLVGHVDEITSFVKTNSPRGWQFLVSKPQAARDMLKALSDQGIQQPQMFTTKKWVEWSGNGNQETPAAISIQAVLADADLMAASQFAEIQVGKARTILVDALGLTADEITEMPFLYEDTFGASLAYQPGTVNLLYISGHAVVPDPFGPVINGKDPFKTDIQTKFDALGVTVHFADDWDLYHRNAGEVHCGTNVVRTLDLAWWESGR